MKLHEVYETKNSKYLCLELIEGVSLKNLIPIINDNEIDKVMY